MNSLTLNISYGVAALLGAVAVVLGILTLLGTSPLVLAPVGIIALGVGELMPEEMFGGVPARQYWVIRAIAGAVAIVLGVLALYGIAPQTMLSLAVVSLGVGLLLPIGTQAGPRGRLEWGLRALSGLAVIVLAGVALAGTSPLMLVAVSLIMLGVTVAAP